MNERETLIAISSFFPFGPARIGLLLKYFGTAKKIWKAGSNELMALGLGKKRTESFLEHKKNFEPKKYFDWISRLKIKVLLKKDSHYPQNLKKFADSPVVLYAKGSLEVLNIRSVSIVGTRKMSSYGREVCELFAGELSLSGICIVSGLARGIDTVAHATTVKNGGFTLAVLGKGLESIYPPENTNLAREIIQKGGCIISEYPLGYPALPANFANRNRIISGISDATLVVEGAEKSGTLLTASHAAEQGKTVFAVPGQITSPGSAAPLLLLKNGARIATSPKDILEELGWQELVERQTLKKLAADPGEEELLLASLENESMHIDELARASSLGSSKVSARLTIMEIKGLVRSMGGGIYKRIG